ncbi:MAG: DEAD/DEAH box helicase [Gemmatimonadota bacterium]
MKLHDYQKEAIEVAWNTLQRKSSAQVVLPTGSGKTLVFVKLADRWFEKNKSRVLIVAHTRELVRNAHRRVLQHTRLTCDIEMAEHRANGAPVVCASVQSMAARLKRYKRNSFGLVIFDEADLAAAPSYDKIRRHFNKAKMYGTTATPDRHDGKKSIAPVVYEKSLREQIESGHLTRIRRIAVKTAEVSRAKLLGGDFDKMWLDEIFSRERHLHEVVRPLLDQAGKRPTLVFGVSVLHSKLLANLFNKYRPGCARWVSGKTTDLEATLEAFKRGEFQFLCNCVLISRGVDLPLVSCIGMARPTLSHTLYKQMLGRGTRLSKETGKKDLLVVDFTFNSDVHSLDVVDAVVGEGQEEVGARAREVAPKNEFDIVDLISEVEGELETNAKLRKRIQAKVRYELRRVVGIDWSVVTEKMWRTMSDHKIAITLNCDSKGVNKHRPQHIPSPGLYKTIDLSSVTKNMWLTMTNKQLASRFNYNVARVREKRPENIPSPGRRNISLLSITDNMWRTMTDKELARKFNCSDVPIRSRRPKHITSPGVLDTEKTIAKITENMWRTMTNYQISNKLKITRRAVAKRRPVAIPSPGSNDQRRIDFSSVTNKMWRTMTDSEIAQNLKCDRASATAHRPSNIISVGSPRGRRKLPKPLL